jgi:hypothetical protein
MVLDEYIEMLQRFQREHPEAKTMPVTDAYGDEPSDPEIVEDSIVLVDKF